MKNKSFIYTIFSIILFSASCNSNSKSKGNENINDETYNENNNYKYEYRTGTSGDYEYNYDIEGVDSEGNSVTGNINTSGKYGSGYIEDASGNEVEVETEWKDYGIMEATDENGNVYEMNVE